VLAGTFVRSTDLVERGGREFVGVGDPSVSWAARSQRRLAVVERRCRHTEALGAFVQVARIHIVDPRRAPLDRDRPAGRLDGVEPPTDPTTRFEDGHTESDVGEISRCSQSGDAGTDDDDGFARLGAFVDRSGRSPSRRTGTVNGRRVVEIGCLAGEEEPVTDRFSERSPMLRGGTNGEEAVRPDRVRIGRPRRAHHVDRLRHDTRVRWFVTGG